MEPWLGIASIVVPIALAVAGFAVKFPVLFCKWNTSVLSTLIIALIAGIYWNVASKYTTRSIADAVPAEIKPLVHDAGGSLVIPWWLLATVIGLCFALLLCQALAGAVHKHEIVEKLKSGKR